MTADLRSRAEQWLSKPWDNESYSANLVRDLLAEVEALTRQRDELLKEKNDTRVVDPGNSADSRTASKA